jgi:hypothetical protein
MITSAGAVRAAVAVASRFGVVCADPAVLKDGSNVVVHLRPAALVARVATTTALVRAGVRAWFDRDLAVARHLVDAGIPAVPPSTDPPAGPHDQDGYVLTLWPYLPHDPAAAVPPAAAAALLAELDVLTGQLAGLAVRPLHGDAHPANLLSTPHGVVWNDFEDAWRGPLCWDLACMLGSPHIDGRAVVDAYPAALPADELDVCLRLRELQAVTWTALLATRFPEREAQAKQTLAAWSRP